MTIDPSTDQVQEIPYNAFIALRKRIVATGCKSLTEAEHSDLIFRCKKKEKRAQELLILAYERMLWRVLDFGKFKKRGFANIDMQESMQEGRMGLLRAVETYDPSLGKFSSYLYWWLRHSERAPNSGDPLIRIDPNRFLANDPTKVDNTTVAICRNVTSLDAPIEGTEDLGIGDMIGSDEPDAEMLMIEGDEVRHCQEFVRRGMRKMTARDRKIIEMRWFGETFVTLEAVGDAFGISRERVRQIEDALFSDLRERISGCRMKPSSMA